MPGMSGLELIKKVREIGLNIQFIIASGYAEFAYAQKAMSYGAVSYCLKPFEESDIIQSLIKARQMIEERKAKIEYRVLELLGEDCENCETAELLLKESGLDAEKKDLLVIVSVGKGRIKLPDDVNWLEFRAGLQKRIYLVEAFYQENLEEYLGKQISDSIRGIGISNKFKKPGYMKNAIDEANTAAYQFFITGANGVKRYETFETRLGSINSCLKQLSESIRDRDLVMVGIYCSNLLGLFKNGMYHIKHAFFAYNMVISFGYSNFSDFQESFIESYEMLFELYRNNDQMFLYLRDHILMQMGYQSGQESQESEICVIKEVIDYVNKNFYKDIYIHSLAEIFYISPNYISRLFKKEVGQNFTEYMAKIRMEHACSLLKETKLSIQQISEKVGYHDYFYFARIFKRITGRTPGAFRNEIV
jgi:Response regulator containing CheY-like receiver domain and AraC-type DNA-binding domain